MAFRLSSARTELSQFTAKKFKISQKCKKGSSQIKYLEKKTSTRNNNRLLVIINRTASGPG